MHTQNQQATMLWMVEHDTDRNRACYLICKAFATQINARQCLKKGIYRARCHTKTNAQIRLKEPEPEIVNTISHSCKLQEPFLIFQQEQLKSKQGF
jgi:hypothetical protein